MACMSKDRYQSLALIDKTLRTLRIAGVGPGNLVFDQLYRARGALMGNIGVKVPRSVTSLLRILGLSPGSVRLFFDGDFGWFTDTREAPGLQPVYRRVTDDIALKIIRGELTHQDFEVLKVPDAYVGE